MADHSVADRPSEQFLTTGQPTSPEQRALETLTRREDYLRAELAGSDKAGASYDRREAAALKWVLGLVAAVEREGGIRDGSVS